MWKEWISTAFIICFLFGLVACSSSDDEGEASGETKYLAKNIIFSHDSSLASKSTPKNNQGIFDLGITPLAYAQSSDIDTETQILAENVIFETSSISQIESDNVQDALEEITLTMSSVIEGTWDIQNYHQEEYHDSTGRIVIYNDGTFDLVEGSFAAIGMGSGTAGDGICSHTEENQTYDIYTEELMAFNHVNNAGPPGIPSTTYAENTALPRLVKLRQNQIIFIVHGGCGEVGRERISVLTRID